MTKSDKNQNAIVHVADSADVIRKIIFGIVTDSENSMSFDQENQPGIANLLNIYAATTNKSIEEPVAQFSHLNNCALFK
jgi:tryptophanyl-tRNA synthetase